LWAISITGTKAGLAKIQKEERRTYSPRREIPIYDNKR
jgi:hypothetical protein